MGTAAHHLGTEQRTFLNPRGGAGGRVSLTRTFHVYLELTMQAKHDAAIRGYCNSMRLQSRGISGTQVTTNWNSGLAAVNWYQQKGTIAIDAAREHMAARWREQLPTAAAVFRPGIRVDAAIQQMRQGDDFHYEVSYWYDGNETYVAFHCYPARR
jgi:hypothetical protein